MTNTTDPLDALEWAIATTGIDRGTVSDLCQETFGVTVWSKLTRTQQWGLVHIIDPEAVGPDGRSARPM